MSGAGARKPRPNTLSAPPCRSALAPGMPKTRAATGEARTNAPKERWHFILPPRSSNRIQRTWGPGCAIMIVPGGAYPFQRSCKVFLKPLLARTTGFYSLAASSFTSSSARPSLGTAPNTSGCVTSRLLDGSTQVKLRSGSISLGPSRVFSLAALHCHSSAARPSLSPVAFVGS
jgi:hypothetical protein